MKRTKLKKILKKYYSSEDSIKSILYGRRKPSYSAMCEMNKNDNVPFTAWQNIKSYMESVQE